MGFREGPELPDLQSRSASGAHQCLDQQQPQQAPAPSTGGDEPRPWEPAHEAGGRASPCPQRKAPSALHSRSPPLCPCGQTPAPKTECSPTGPGPWAPRRLLSSVACKHSHTQPMSVPATSLLGGGPHAPLTGKKTGPGGYKHTQTLTGWWAGSGPSPACPWLPACCPPRAPWRLPQDTALPMPSGSAPSDRGESVWALPFMPPLRV